jgi:hypothetical protein
MKTAMLVVGLCALVGAAEAQTIYKCTVDGKVSYGEQPCAHGKTTEIAVQPAPDVVPLPALLKEEKARLAALQKERAAVEAREERERQRTARAAAATKSKCARLRLQVKWADEDAARADKQTTERARLKARRQAEELAVQCPA